MLTQKERVAIVRKAGHTGYDRSLDKKVQMPKKFGICLLPALQEKINPAPAEPEKPIEIKPAEVKVKAKKLDRRKKTGKITFRVFKWQKELLLRDKARKGYDSLQVYLDREVFLPWFEKIEKSEGTLAGVNPILFAPLFANREEDRIAKKELEHK